MKFTNARDGNADDMLLDNVTMLSQGQSILDKSFSLSMGMKGFWVCFWSDYLYISPGILTMQLDKETYERIGLPGRCVDHRPSAQWGKCRPMRF